ncbi:MAG: VanZ family protein [Clostridia bacterium]|nr:VanZ family protein [Clostridia bacterium]
MDAKPPLVNDGQCNSDSTHPRKAAGQRKPDPKRTAMVLCCVFASITILWLCFIFSNSLKSADVSSRDSGRLLAFLQKLLPALSDHVLRKMAHFAEFAVLGVLAALTAVFFIKLRRLRASGTAPVKIFPVLCVLFAFGILCPVIDELLQSLSPGRSTEFLDMLIDFGGFTFGALFPIAAYIFKLSASSRKSSRPIIK